MKRQGRKIAGDALGIVGLLLVFCYADALGIFLATKVAAFALIWAGSKLSIVEG